MIPSEETSGAPLDQEATLTVDDLGRSLKGTAALVNRRPDALAAFDVSGAGFRRSFLAVLLTVPAMVVSVGLVRTGAGLDVEGWALLDDHAVVAATALAHLGSFLALPAAMAFVLRGTAYGERFVPFVIATNWISAYGALALSVPGALFLMRIETAPLSVLFTCAFAVIAIQAQWWAARLTLGLDGRQAAAVAALGLLLDLSASGALSGVVG